MRSTTGLGRRYASEKGVWRALSVEPVAGVDVVKAWGISSPISCVSQAMLHREPRAGESSRASPGPLLAAVPQVRQVRLAGQAAPHSDIFFF